MVFVAYGIYGIWYLWYMVFMVYHIYGVCTDTYSMVTEGEPQFVWFHGMASSAAGKENTK